MDRYSRWVAVLKVLLPLTALALLSTLFLLSRNADPDARIPFAERETTERLRDQQITKATYAGTSSNGEDVFIMAAKVSPPADDKPAWAEEIEARLDGKRGQRIWINAARGTLEDQIGRATFLDRVVIKTSTGYVLETEMLTAELQRSAAIAPGEVLGYGPLGDFRAGSMELAPKIDDDGLHIIFKNGVRLVYDPKKTER